MNLVVNNHNVFLIVFVTFLVSVLLVPIVKKVAKHVGAMDVPNARKVHKVPMPRLGGLAIYIAFLFGYILYGQISTQMISILIGSFLLIIVGIFDDINSVPAKYKFLVQIVAASIVVIYGKLGFSELTVFGLSFHFPMIINDILAIFFIVAITNAINLIDGLDGLSSGISAIYFLTIAIIALITNKIGGIDIILSLIMLGATLGFLFHNFPPAKIFMGDTGSLFLGFIISVIALLGFKTATITSLIIPLLTLFVPIIDTFFAMCRRMLRGESIDHADREHLHHQLLKTTKSTKKTVIIMYLINTLFALVSIFYTLGDKKISIILYLILLILFIVLVMKTDILFEHEKKGKK